VASTAAVRRADVNSARSPEAAIRSIVSRHVARDAVHPASSVASVAWNRAAALRP
jgi:hypothetical protein